MAQKKRKKYKLEARYKRRRAVLVLLCVALAGFLAWRLLPLGGVAEQVDLPAENPTDPTLEVSQTTGPEESAPTEPQATEPPTEPEPEKPKVQAEWNLLLVNSTNPLPDDFTVELERVGDYQVDARIADSLYRMFNQAREDGIDLMLCSAYRAREKQEQLFEQRKQENMERGMSEEDAEVETALLTARPGTSEHATGLAVDIVTPEYQGLNDGFAETPAFKWLDQYAQDYGFILRYPKNKESITQISYEPWHYRYVGVQHAGAIKESGYCLEEYLYVAMRDQLSSQDMEDADEPVDDENPEEMAE